MDALLFLLHELENSHLPDDSEKILHSDEHVSIQLIKQQATGVLITKEGDPAFELIDELYHDHGYFVFPGERDRFGWLTACIQTKKGIIVFG